MIEDTRKTLWAIADKLGQHGRCRIQTHRARLTFVKYISDTFQTRRDELKRHFADADLPPTLAS
jgi:type I restriction enzyme M protein